LIGRCDFAAIVSNTRERFSEPEGPPAAQTASGPQGDSGGDIIGTE